MTAIDQTARIEMHKARIHELNRALLATAHWLEHEHALSWMSDDGRWAFQKLFADTLGCTVDEAAAQYASEVSQ